MSDKVQDILIRSVSQLHQLLGSGPPEHPQISAIRQDDRPTVVLDRPVRFRTDFYIVMMKRNINSKVRYGQQYYDFNEGILATMAPGQVFRVDGDHDGATGWLLVFHPDLIRSFPLAKTISNYGFFSYDVNEALHLSAKEEKMLERLFKNIREEYRSAIDPFSQDVLVSQLDLLFNYINRFYHRQFLTRKAANSDLVARLEQWLNKYFETENIREIPSVHYIAGQLHLSPNYLSDMLRANTGKSTQQHIQDKLIQKAKDMLSTTGLSVSEIAYHLGFEHAQSFSRLFKRKTGLTPLSYRTSFN